MFKFIILTLLMSLFLVSCGDSSDDGGELISISSLSQLATTFDNKELLSSNKKYYVIKTPTALVESIPEFDDDLDFRHLDLAISEQLKAFDRFGLEGEITFGNKKYSLSILEKSIKLFSSIVEVAEKCIEESSRSLCLQQFNDSIKDKFTIYGPQSNSDETPGTNVTYTAYYSPVFHGSKTKTEKYPYAIYKLPSDEKLRKSTREQIIWEGALDGEGLELFYIDSLWDLYILHLEGGGAVEIDGKLHNLSYEGYNSNRFKFISRYMKSMGYIEDTSVASQKAYLDANPDKWREIYSQCPGYIYFTESYSPPVGLEDIPLTDNRSIAQDKKYYKRKGIISYVIAKRPVKENGKIIEKEFSRFYIDQDTGSAIQGGARADLYFGFGEEAELAGSNLHNVGQMYYLIAK